MTALTDAAPPAATRPGLPDDRRRLIELDDGIAAIRTQIAAADLARQRRRTPIDPDWLHRARTALRHLRRERAELLARAQGAVRRDGVKDAIIAILRERFEPAAWTAIIAEAHARLDQGEAR